MNNIEQSTEVQPEMGTLLNSFINIAHKAYIQARHEIIPPVIVAICRGIMLKDVIPFKASVNSFL